MSSDSYHPRHGSDFECCAVGTLAELARLKAGLSKINEIRNSIVGLQTLNWSEHIYPLVAALNEAGCKGLPYPEARGMFGTMLERTNAAEAQVAQLRAALEELVDAYEDPTMDDPHKRVIDAKAALAATNQLPAESQTGTSAEACAGCHGSGFREVTTHAGCGKKERFPCEFCAEAGHV